MHYISLSLYILASDTSINNTRVVYVARSRVYYNNSVYIRDGRENILMYCNNNIYICVYTVRVLLLSIAYVRFTRPNKFFFFVLLLFSFLFTVERKIKATDEWKHDHSILISLRRLPLLRLQNDLFIRSKRPMPFEGIFYYYK